ncbi:MAG: methionyl-tRNA formyltransferase [Lachnospiraceae bacterium]|nr:methionyl-tRNA formyltransferase [Lachnospiraceae bacterium]
MKIVYMGTPDFAVGPLESIIKAGHEVSAVVTQPDRAKGRSKELQMCPVKECAVKYGIPVFQPERIKRPEAVEELKKYPADIYVVAAFGQILSQEILDIPKYGCVNIHASLLPEYRGAAPIQRVILDGKEKTGVTIMQMDKGLDTGDILMQEEIEISPDETGGSLFDKLAGLGAELIVKALPLIEKGDLTPVKQDDSQSSYAAMFSKEDGWIEWGGTAAAIERQVRGCAPWPSAYTSIGGRNLKIWKSCISELPDEVRKSAEAELLPGTVVISGKDKMFVMCGDSSLEILEVQLEGKKRMPVKDFLLGYHIDAGTRLGR